MFLSSASLMASQVLTAGVGFVFCVIAARRFDEASVGFASAAISTMSLLGAIGTAGLGTLLIREMPINRGNEHRMLVAAIAVSSGLGAALGIGFVVLAPIFSSELEPLHSNWLIAAMVILGSALTAGTLNMDQALVGLLRSELQLVRNVVAAIGRLLLLIGAVVMAVGAASVAMIGAWSLALLASLVAMLVIALRGGRLRSALPPAWHLLRFHRLDALQHHLLNLAIQVPGWVMPLITLTVLSAATNARFYLAWMLIGLASFIPVALTWTLYASASRDPRSLVREGRITLGLSLASAVVSIGVIIVLGRPVLSILGASYAMIADGPLPLLALTLLPVPIKAHFVTIHRVRRTLRPAVTVVAGGAVLEIMAAGIGARVGDLTGLSVGLLTAMAIEAVVMAPTVYGAIVANRSTGFGLEETQ
jgi:O-antigen/teichoic acid export membrane protein